MTVDWDEFIGQFPESHTIGLEEFAGAGAHGTTYAASIQVDQCFVDSAQRKRVRVQTADAAGAEVVSSTQVYCPPGTGGAASSRVTLPDGTVSRVIVRKVLDAAGLALPEHITLFLE